MITTQKLTNEAYVITVDGEDSIDLMKALVLAGLDMLCECSDVLETELEDFCSTIVKDSWK